jgi:hypothetical protein
LAAFMHWHRFCWWSVGRAGRTSPDTDSDKQVCRLVPAVAVRPA